MAHLACARLLVAAMPFERWRNRLGWDGGSPAVADPVKTARARAADIEWAAKRMPIPIKCLPRAMALSWMLRRKHIAHAVVFAVRPPGERGSDDDLHAWVELGGEKLIGDLPGPWVETLQLGRGRQA